MSATTITYRAIARAIGHQVADNREFALSAGDNISAEALADSLAEILEGVAAATGTSFDRDEFIELAKGHDDD